MSTIDDEYTRATLALADKLEDYFTLVGGHMGLCGCACRVHVCRAPAWAWCVLVELGSKEARVSVQAPCRPLHVRAHRRPGRVPPTRPVDKLQDVYDKRRVPLIKELKGDAQVWVTKYARGGSVRKQSARRFYIALDAVLGFLASNGCAARAGGRLGALWFNPACRCLPPGGCGPPLPPNHPNPPAARLAKIFWLAATQLIQCGAGATPRRHGVARNVVIPACRCSQAGSAG